jgi:hypothetical protein
MKKMFLAISLMFLLCSSAFAGYVSGYYRSNGTYVNGYQRSEPNYTVRDNYSYKGNYNPYTGSTGRNYYRSNPSSDYYRGY